jgi:hypothetical protein
MKYCPKLVEQNNEKQSENIQIPKNNKFDFIFVNNELYA